MSIGNRSYVGYEYQIHVIVFMLLNEYKNLAFKELIVESDFGHDAEISSEDIGNEYISINAKSISKTQISKKIQIKTKERNRYWQPSEFRDVLLKSDERIANSTNVDILDSLIANPKDIFIFITNGILSIDLAALRCTLETLERDAHDTKLEEIKGKIFKSIQKGSNHEYTKQIVAKLSIDHLQRIFIVDNLEFEQLQSKIRDILIYSYHFPHHRTSSVATQLVELVRSRMLRINGEDRIKANELENIIGKYNPDNILPDLLERFVKTPAYTKALDILQNSHLVILTGEPYVGKTTIAQALAKFYVEKGHELIEPIRDNAHLDIARAVSNKDDKIFFLDDLFGDLNRSQNDVQGNQFGILLNRVCEAKGRIKVVITARTNVLSETKATSKLCDVNISPYIVDIAPPSSGLKYNVLMRLLDAYNSNVVELILKCITVGEFENLLHVNHFATAIKHYNNLDNETIGHIFEANRTTAYREWLKNQSDSSRLFLYILDFLISANYFAWDEDLERIFALASQSINMPRVPGFGDLYSQAFTQLEKQARIQRLPNKSINFIHPEFHHAVSKYFYEHEFKIATFISSLIKEIKTNDQPIDQSVAAILCMRYNELIGRDANHTIRELSTSRFVQTRETIIRKGGLFLHKFLLEEPIESREGADLVAQLLVEPSDCMINESGQLVVREKVQSDGELYREYTEQVIKRIDLQKENFEVEKLRRFKSALKSNSIEYLNPIEKYELGLWLLGRQKEISFLAPFNLIASLGNDPISFVRVRAADFFNEKNLVDQSDYQDLFINLSYDGHPYVKIAMLEKVILRYWRFLPPENQERCLNIVCDMLDDTLIRRRCGPGLLNQSGARYYYHANHTPKQIEKWFIAIAPKLLQYKFDHFDHLDRLLTGFDLYFPGLPRPYRTNLLRFIDEYIDSYNEFADETIYGIEKITLTGNPDQEEKDILINMIQKLSVQGRARICYTFAKEYSNLSDLRLRNLVERPFFTEMENEFITEQSATVLGFLMNSNLKPVELPEPLRRFDNNSASEAISKYIFSKSDLFKLQIVLMSYQHDHLYKLPSLYDKVYKQEVIEKLILFFSDKSVDHALSIANMLLRNLYYVSPDLCENKISLEESNWYKLFKPFLYNTNIEIRKEVCNLIFTSIVESSTHNALTCAYLVYLALAHSDDFVAKHAMKNFYKYNVFIINLIFDPQLPDSWRAEIKSRWASKEFVTKLEAMSKSNDYGYQ